MPIAISIPSLPSIVPDWHLEHNFGALASRMTTISNAMERRSLEIIGVSNSTRLPKVGYALVGKAVEGEDIMSLLREQASCIRDESGRRLLIEKPFKIKADMAPSDNEKHTGEELAAQMSYIFPRLPRPPRIAPDFARLYSAAPSCQWSGHQFEYAHPCPRPLPAESSEALSGKYVAYDGFVKPSYLDSGGRLRRDTSVVCARVI